MWNESMPEPGQISQEILEVLPKEAFFTIQDWHSEGQGLYAKLRLKTDKRVSEFNLPAWDFWDLIDRDDGFIFLSAKKAEDLAKAKEIVSRTGCLLAYGNSIEDQRFMQDKVIALALQKAEGYYYKLLDKNQLLVIFQAAVVDSWPLEKLTKEQVLGALKNFKAKQ